MKRILRVLAALAVLAALMGAEGSCQRERVDTNRPPAEHKVDPAKKRVVTIKANSTGPYTLLVIARDGRGGVDRYGPEPYAPGEHLQTLDYETGAKLEIRVLVYGHAKDEMRCSIDDGPTNRDDQVRNKEALCLLTTAR